jgi:surface protein
MDWKIIDEQGRDLLVCNGSGEVAIARYPDMTDETKEYHVKFFGLGISGFSMQTHTHSSYDGYKKYLTKVVSFGKLGHKFTSLKHAFYQCQNNFTVPYTLPSSITNISSMFRYCMAFNQPLSTWNTSKVKNMSYMFYNCTDFNQPLHDWNTSNVSDINYIFYKCNISEQNKPIFKQ